MINKKGRINFDVLITRPLPFATQLCDLISSFGGQAYSCPMFEVINLPLTLNLKKLQSYQHVVFLSISAVMASTKIIKQLLSLNMPPHFWAIGPATKSMLLALQVPDVSEPKEFSSEGLLQCLTDSIEDSQKIDVFCGQEGRQFLLKTLTALGHIVEPIYIYKRKPIMDVSASIRKLTQNCRKRIVVVCTSVSGLKLFLLAIKKLLKEEQRLFINASLVVVSVRILQFARQHWFNQAIFVAQGISNPEIVKTLLSL